MGYPIKNAYIGVLAVNFKFSSIKFRRYSVIKPDIL